MSLDDVSLLEIESTSGLIFSSSISSISFDVEFSTLDSSSPHIISGMSPCALGVRGVDARGPETLSSISIEVSDMLLFRS